MHPKVLQERLGHASIRTTLDTYGHLFDGMDEAVANTLEDVFRASRVGDSLVAADAAVIELGS